MESKLVVNLAEGWFPSAACREIERLQTDKEVAAVDGNGEA